ncbi:MAG TPA: hypothetical protein VGO62_10720, partial [Myxococcota bacterium]
AGQASHSDPALGTSMMNTLIDDARDVRTSANADGAASLGQDARHTLILAMNGDDNVKAMMHADPALQSKRDDLVGQHIAEGTPGWLAEGASGLRQLGAVMEVPVADALAVRDAVDLPGDTKEQFQAAQKWWSVTKKGAEDFEEFEHEIPGTSAISKGLRAGLIAAGAFSGLAQGRVDSMLKDGGVDVAKYVARALPEQVRTQIGQDAAALGKLAPGVGVLINGVQTWNDAHDGKVINAIGDGVEAAGIALSFVPMLGESGAPELLAGLGVAIQAGGTASQLDKSAAQRTDEKRTVLATMFDKATADGLAGAQLARPLLYTGGPSGPVRAGDLLPPAALQAFAQKHPELMGDSDVMAGIAAAARELHPSAAQAPAFLEAFAHPVSNAGGTPLSMRLATSSANAAMQNAGDAPAAIIAAARHAWSRTFPQLAALFPAS